MSIAFFGCRNQPEASAKANKTGQSGKDTEWVFLFNSSDVSQWRSEKSNNFPEKGWTGEFEVNFKN